MCFSASASFIASAYLTGFGALCLKNNKVAHAKPFAAIPFIFAIQQAIEGLLWLSHTHHWAALQRALPYFFVLFAFFVWPIWIPCSLALIERHTIRRKIIGFLAMIGTIVALYLYSFVLLHGVTAMPSNCHIYYQISIPASETVIGSISYLLATALPFFVSSIPAMWLFGVVLLISYWISYIFYFKSLISIWCFFAAILSGFAYVVIKELNKR